MRIFGWQADFAGCAWYRIVLPLGALRQQGTQAEWGNKLLPRHGDCDVIVAQRTCKPGPTGLFQGMAQLPGKRPKLVYELDDDLLNLDPANPASEFYNDPQVQKNILANVRVADLVTVSTEPLAERMRKYNPNVAVLPNCIPADLLDWQPGHYNDRITIGWQGSPTHDGDWAAAALPIGRWFNGAKGRRLPLEFHTTGALPRTFPKLFPHRISPWVGHDTFYHSLDWHIAVAPLANTMFNNSKSDLRPLEAAALGFPVVASDVIAYRGFVEHGETGFLVSKPAEWGKYLGELASDPDLRGQMSKAARDLASTRTVEGNARRWLEAYANV